MSITGVGQMMSDELEAARFMIAKLKHRDFVDVYATPIIIRRPSALRKDANVTVLFYRRDRIPSNEMPDTELVQLDVCMREGLQQISWASRALSETEMTARFAQTVALGVQKYGESKPTPEGTLAWKNGRIETLSVSEPDGKHRILMVSRGLEFDRCSAEHDLGSTEGLRTRWLRRPELPN